MKKLVLLFAALCLVFMCASALWAADDTVSGWFSALYVVVVVWLSGSVAVSWFPILS